jgi:hypothetical protein
MKLLTRGARPLLLVSLIWVLSACGQAVTTALAQGPAAGTSFPQNHERKSIAPRSSSDSDLLYAADTIGGVYVVSYPAGVVQEQLNVPEASAGPLCSDASGDVFIPSERAGEIFEYAHGGSEPIQTLDDEGGAAYGCSVDPTTGNLAVANINVDGYDGDVVIYNDAQGKPISYYDSRILNFFWCGYDDQGNLFADGNGGLAELPTGGSTFENIALGKDVGGGQVQWDGKHIAISSEVSHSIVRLSISGSSARIVGRTHLVGALGPHSGGGSWIQDGTVIAPVERARDRLGMWQYPKGGKPKSSVRLGREAHVVGVTLSVEP